MKSFYSFVYEVFEGELLVIFQFIFLSYIFFPNMLLLLKISLKLYIYIYIYSGTCIYTHEYFTVSGRVSYFRNHTRKTRISKNKKFIQSNKVNNNNIC